MSLPKYFSSEWSHAQYRLPTRNPHAETLSLGGHTDPSTGATSDGEEKCVVGWIEVGSDASTTSAAGKENITPSASKPGRRSSATGQDFAGGSKGVRTLTPTPSSSNSSPSRGATSSGKTGGGEVEHQLVALTYSGGWYRLALPSSASAPLATSSSSSRRESSDLGDDEEEGGEVKPGVQCRLVEFRRFGQESAFGGSAGGGKGFGS